jgi:hypothetical protein
MDWSALNLAPMSQGVANALYGGIAVNVNKAKQEEKAIIAKAQSSMKMPVQAKNVAMEAQKASGNINVAMPGQASSNFVLSAPQVNVSKYLGVMTLPGL